MARKTKEPGASALTGEQFSDWMDSRELTQKDVSDWFGVSRRSVNNYRRNGVSRVHALAIAAIERGLPPWEPGPEDVVTHQETEEAS